jgi:pilus assembly protein Flp/PilA
MRRLTDLRKNERGATAVEYGLIIALVFLAMVGAVSTFAATTTTMWNDVSTKVKGS